MKVMVITKANEDYEKEADPMKAVGGPEMMQAMGKDIDAMVKAGVLLAADGLKPSRYGKRVDFAGTKRTVTDGPFAETKELISGFFICEVRSMEEALEWVKRFPNPIKGTMEVEVRPLWGPEDFGQEIAAQVEAREKAAGDKLAY